MPVADEDRTAAGTLEANYKRIGECAREAAVINRRLLSELNRLRESNARQRRRIEVLEAANRELRAWRDVAEKLKIALGKEEITNAEPISADGSVPQDRGGSV